MSFNIVLLFSPHLFSFLTGLYSLYGFLDQVIYVRFAFLAALVLLCHFPLGFELRVFIENLFDKVGIGEFCLYSFHYINTSVNSKFRFYLLSFNNWILVQRTFNLLRKIIKQIPKFKIKFFSF